MSNPGMRITRAGLNVLGRGFMGDRIHFTKAQVGDGDFDYDTESVLDLTALKSPKLDLPIVDKIDEGDGTVTIVSQLTNYQIAKGFRAKEHGIFAIDPLTGKEVLYAYRNAGEEYSFVPAALGPVHGNIRHAYTVEIGDAKNVTFNINFAFAYAPLEEYRREISAIKFRLADLWEIKLLPSTDEIFNIINGSYASNGSDGEGELNGVPTKKDIDNIIAGTYTHRDIETDEYALDDVPTEAEINKIIAGTYSDEVYSVSTVPTEEDITKIINGTY